jgi:hypothetical protein
MAERALRRTYTPDEVDTGLTVLALCGGDSSEAERRLQAAGQPIPSSTLRDWRTHTHADRYVAICHERAPEIEKRVLQRSQEIQQRALATSLKAVNEAERQLDNGEAKDPAGTAKNLALTYGIITDKSLLLQGRPNVMVGTQDARDLLDDIRRELGTIPGTAIEVPTTALSPRSDSTNAQED